MKMSFSGHFNRSLFIVRFSTFLFHCSLHCLGEVTQLVIPLTRRFQIASLTVIFGKITLLGVLNSFECQWVLLHKAGMSAIKK